MSIRNSFCLPGKLQTHVYFACKWTNKGHNMRVQTNWKVIRHFKDLIKTKRATMQSTIEDIQSIYKLSFVFIDVTRWSFEAKLITVTKNTDVSISATFLPFLYARFTLLLTAADRFASIVYSRRKQLMWQLFLFITKLQFTVTFSTLMWSGHYSFPIQVLETATSFASCRWDKHQHLAYVCAWHGSPSGQR